MKTKKGFVLRNVCGENIIVAEGKENIDFTKIISIGLVPTNSMAPYIVAGDYCVINTIKNLQPIWDRLSVYLPGIASIDGGTALQEFIKENKLNIYQPIEK